MSKRKNPNDIPPDLQVWIDVRRRHHLSHAHVQMARELGICASTPARAIDVLAHDCSCDLLHGASFAPPGALG